MPASSSARISIALGWMLSAVALLLFPAMVPNGLAAATSSDGTWSTLAPAPSKRTEVAAAAVRSTIYVVGGFATPALSNIKDLAITTTVEAYDVETDRWSSKAPLPVGLHHTGIAVIGQQLYVVGGFTKSMLSVWSPTASLYRYDPGRDGWTALPPMPTARGALAVAVVDGKLLAIGGYDGDKNSAAVELYDPDTNRWTSRAPLPTPRDHLAAVAVGDRIYAIGGRLDRDYRRNLGVTERYEMATDRWTRAADLPTPRSGIAAGLIEGSVYVLGGEAPTGTFATNEAYDPEHDRWRTMAPMPTARHGLGSAVVGGHLYVISGGPSPGGSFSNVNERYTPPAAARPSARTGRADPHHVRAVMALLQLYQEARALPPEDSPEANLIIKALIQFQSALTRSERPAIQRLRERAFAEAFGTDAPAALATFRQNGWNPRAADAIIQYADGHAIWQDPELEGLDQAFGEFNVGPGDLERLADVVRTARRHLVQQETPTR